MVRALRCLLAGPVPGRDGENGDVQYVLDLLADPPDGVTYVTYADALDSGELLDGPSFNPKRRLPRTLRSASLAAARTGLFAARRGGLLLPDPVRWWEVTGDFDVVHSHCFPIRFVGTPPPVVATDSAGTFWYWTDAVGYPEAVVWRRLRRERRLAQTFGYLHPTVRPDAFGQVLYFVESGRGLAGRLGAPTERIGLAPAGVPRPLRRSELTLDPPVLLFVARNFDIKGGPDLLAALGTIREQFPEGKLLVAGPDLPRPDWPGVTWLGPLTRQELYRDVYPHADLFVYPTRFDVAPLVVAEALAHGIPVVATRRFGLPDLVRDQDTGVLVEPGRPDLVAEAVIGLLRQPDRLRQMGGLAAADFEARLSAEVRNRALGAAYRQVLNR